MAMSNKFTPPIELPSIWGTRVQAESPLTKEAHPQSYHLYGHFYLPLQSAIDEGVIPRQPIVTFPKSYTASLYWSPITTQHGAPPAGQY